MTLSKKPLVVLDSNVFVSAIVWGGLPERVINFWLEGKFTLFISPAILFETLVVLEEFDVPHEVVNGFKYQIETRSVKIIPKTSLKICRDEKDDKFLELCLACQADFLVTGDRDLLVLKRFETTKIIKPREFLKIFQN